jgi:hypothetical protein
MTFVLDDTSMVSDAVLSVALQRFFDCDVDVGFVYACSDADLVGGIWQQQFVDTAAVAGVFACKQRERSGSYRRLVCQCDRHVITECTGVVTTARLGGASRSVDWRRRSMCV